jgi:hypothetical protein
MHVRSTTRRLHGRELSRVVHSLFALAALLGMSGPLGLTTLAAAEAIFVPQPGVFPPPNSGSYAAGELVSVDHVNRRGALRLVGDGVDNNYHGAPSYRFAMLPYGTLRYHGAPAELRDIPIGTVLHGYFLPPPADNPAADKSPAAEALKNFQALTIEDDFSFYQSRGQSWKVVAVDTEKGKLNVSATGETLVDGQKGEQTFDCDASTRVWKGRQIGSLKDLAPDQLLQVNLTWAPDWQNGHYHVTDVWIDSESREAATEVQRQVHVHYQRYHWLAGWVDHVEHQSGSRGIVTVTLFSGMDPTLYDQARAQAKVGGASIAAAENTLRTWWQEHDSKNGPVLDYTDIPNPPPGSSGLQLRVQISELLEGYRPGRIIRFRPNSFPNVKLPPEERVKSFDER